MTHDDSLNLSLVLELAVGGGGDRVAVTFGEDCWTYVELVELVERWRDHLLAVGASGVTVIGENDPGMVGLLFGASLAGVDVSFANPRLKTHELVHVLETTASAAAYLWGVRSSAPEEAARCLGSPPVLFSLTTAEPPEADLAVPPSQRSGAGHGSRLYVFTSGTTSLPKAVVLPQHALVQYLLNSYAALSASPDEANLVTVPLFHIAGIMNVLSSMFMTRRVVLLPRFDPDEWIRSANREQVTQAFLVPSMLREIVGALEREPAQRPAKLRAIAYGGAPSRPADVLAALEAFHGVEFVGAFGLTETSSTICVLGPEDHELARRSARPELILSSVGRPIPGVEIAVVDPHGGVSTTPEVEGEIVVRGPQISPGYVNAPSRIDADGWFHTGDVGGFDLEGRLHLEGRVDDMIQRGAENVSPLEVELAFTDCPGVSETAAVGIPDPRWGEVVLLAVVADGSVAVEKLVAALPEWAAARLAAHKRPACYVVVDELPRNALGKLLRKQILELADRAASVRGAALEQA